VFRSYFSYVCILFLDYNKHNHTAHAIINHSKCYLSRYIESTCHTRRWNTSAKHTFIRWFLLSIFSQSSYKFYFIFIIFVPFDRFSFYSHVDNFVLNKINLLRLCVTLRRWIEFFLSFNNLIQMMFDTNKF
jgi:hypothetical protein